ncbi:hypothetical protein A6A03_05510 [Chloroflexus islandicus]|uniref:Uncharacterized protein n=1 Tax=Chloroflexus islandicus TaxID=1707952 RepID=A0A178LU11_9CHLR|nr:hypothetical protein [Chloroflexus islandicus]OAN37100.1 hypothetical protein A6A03_05510 [Chloroflexus islandicus]
MIRHLLLILLLALLVAPFPVAAQPPSPITISIKAGIDGEGAFRSDHWFPVQVTLANDGPDRRVTLEWRDLNNAVLSQRYVIDLPGGARKQITFPVVQSGRSAQLIATADGEEIFRQRINLNQLSNDLLTIGLLSADPAVLSSLATADFGAGKRAVILPLDPAVLADDPLLLSTFDAVAVRELTTDVRPAQRDAILLWVQQGGTLLIGGGAVGETAIRAFADVLPVTVGPLRRDAPVSELERLANLSGISNFVPSLTAQTVTLRPNAQALTNDGLISQMTLGTGKIVFAAFDLAALRAWPGESNLWAAVLDPQPRMNIGANFRFGFNDLLQGSLNTSLFPLPSTIALLALIGVYIIVIGPANFLALRRLRRLEWAWVTTPLIVVIFLAGSYGMSFALRGTQTQVLQLAIVQSAASGGEAMTTTFTGIFAPQRQSYTLSFADSALVAPLQMDERLVIEHSDAGLAMPDLLLDAAAFRTLIVEQITTSSVQIRHQIALNGQRWSGTLANASSIPLRDVMVVYQNDMQWIGSLAPGAEVAIDLSTNSDNFLRDFMPTEEGSLFSHTFVLENLFWYVSNRFDPFMNGPALPGDDIYLIGWSDQAAPLVQINGAPAAARGETLYIIALR